MLKNATVAILAACLAVGISVPCFASDIQDVGALIDHRLSFMRDVAAYKREHQRPVEDLPQERKVVERVLQTARANGLDASSVEPLVQAQMSVAKAVQYRYLAQWQTRPEPKDAPPPKSLEQVRQALADSDERLMQALAKMLAKQDAFGQADQRAFVDSLHQRYLDPQEKLHLFQALQQVRRGSDTAAKPVGERG